MPIPGADGYAYGGQRDGQTDDVEDPVDRLQTRDAGLGAWGAGAEAARFHGGGKFGGAPDGEHQQSERLGEGTGDGVTVAKAARTLGQAECAPIFLQQRKHAQSSQPAVYESRREVQNLNQTVRQISGIEAQGQNHAGYGNGRHPDSRGDGQINGSLADHNPAALPQDLARGAAVEKHGDKTAGGGDPYRPGLTAYGPRSHATNPQQHEFDAERRGRGYHIQTDEHRNTQQQRTDDAADRVDARDEP